MVPNFFSGSGFDLISMTAAINKVPDAARYIGFLSRFNLFRPTPISTITYTVEEKNGVLNLLTSQPRGGPVPQNSSGKRKIRSFQVPHYPLEDTIKAEEIQGVRAFGSENQAETEANVMATKLGEMRRKHELTHEWLRMKALEGIIVDGDGSTLYNLYTEFGISEKVIDYDLDDSATDVNAKGREVADHIEDNLKGDTFTGIVAVCARDFYNDLVKHASVKEAFKYFQTTQQLSGDFRKGFEFGGITYIPFNANTTDAAGTARKFVPDGFARVFPLGTQQTFMEVMAPADFMETANTMGLPFYAKQEPMEFNRGVKVHTQSNVLPFCTRPEILVKLGKNID